MLKSLLILPLLIVLQTPLFAAEITTTPTARLNQGGWKARHLAKVAEAAKGGYDVVFIGDSITQGWEGHGKNVWAKYYAPRKALNIGFSGDHTENVLWRLDNGELPSTQPKLYVVMIGTNNTGQFKDDPKDTAAGVKAILQRLATHSPDAQVLLLAIFTRGANPDDPYRLINDEVNKQIQTFATKNIHYLDINENFMAHDGTLPRELMPDFLHPQGAGYFLWAKAMELEIKKLLQE